MRRPGTGQIVKTLQHSLISDLYWKIEVDDLTGRRNGYWENLIEKHCPRSIYQLNALNKKDCKLNKKDINIYGYWEP